MQEYSLYIALIYTFVHFFGYVKNNKRFMVHVLK